MTRPGSTTLVREELVRVRARRPCDRRAELAGLLRAAGGVEARDDGRFTMETTTEHAGVARRIFEALGEALGARGEIQLIDPGRRRPRARYVVRAGGVSLQRLVEAGIVGERGTPGALIPRHLVQRECCVRAYLRGAFVARGSISGPRGSPHLEIRAPSEAAAAELARLLGRAGAAARTRAHRGGWSAYLKGTAPIGTALAALGAHDAYLAWEEGAVWKAVHTQASRLRNADAANARRLARAAVRQLAAIDEIDDGPGLRSLPPALREAAELRRIHPDASIEELARSVGITKPAFAGRLRRLVGLAEAGMRGLSRRDRV